MQVQIPKNPFVRSPTLDTVLMIEKKAGDRRIRTKRFIYLHIIYIFIHN